jgi:hypothetical protein
MDILPFAEADIFGSSYCPLLPANRLINRFPPQFLLNASIHPFPLILLPFIHSFKHARGRGRQIVDLTLIAGLPLSMNEQPIAHTNKE